MHRHLSAPLLTSFFFPPSGLWKYENGPAGDGEGVPLENGPAEVKA